MPPTSLVGPLSLLAPPRVWVHHLRGMGSLGQSHSSKERAARNSYLNLLASVLTSASLVCDISKPAAEYGKCIQPLREGQNFPAFGITMAGGRRLQNIHDLLQRVHTNKLAGSYVECGVWRGGMSIFAKAIIEVYDMNRIVYLCDSFQGLPPPRSGSPRSDETWYVQSSVNATLAQGQQRVQSNFRDHGVPMAAVHFVPGYFVNSLPGLRASLLARGETLSVLRLDGDMYDSTIDILFNLYDLVAVGGYVVIDDFGWKEGISETAFLPKWGAKDAILGFRALHGIEDEAHTFHDIDGMGAWFQKGSQVELQRAKYLDAVQTGNYTALQPLPKLTPADYLRLMHKYETLQGHAKTT